MANASLRKRGSLLIWLDKDVTWPAPHDGKPGRPSLFSDAAIRFKLPLRQTTGMVASLLKMADTDWSVPDCTTLCRSRSKQDRGASGKRVTRPRSTLSSDQWRTMSRPETRPRAKPGAAAGHSGSAGPDTTPEAAWRYEPGQKTIGGSVFPAIGCPRGFARTCGAQPARPQGLRRTHREPRDPDRQTAEIHIRIALMNRFSALGTADIVRMA